MFVARRKEIDADSYMEIIQKSKENIDKLNSDDIISNLEKLVPGFNHNSKYVRKDI